MLNIKDKRRTLWRQKTEMKEINYNKPSEPIVNFLNDSEAIYYTAPMEQRISLQGFEDLCNKLPLTQKEWAGILLLSEKTLQRYAKEGKGFEGIYADRLRQIKRIIDLGITVFGNGEELYRWLKRKKKVMGRELSLDALQTSEGIRATEFEIGRIAYGVYI